MTKLIGHLTTKQKHVTKTMANHLDLLQDYKKSEGTGRGAKNCSISLDGRVIPFVGHATPLNVMANTLTPIVRPERSGVELVIQVHHFSE